MQPRQINVTTPMFVVDTATEERFKGNSASVCFVPTSIYSNLWSTVNSLEASFGRGQPEEELAINPAEDEKYAEKRHQQLGHSFQQLAKELRQSELAVVYRLPAARVQHIQEQIRVKVKEFEGEYEQRCQEHSDARMSAPAADDKDDEMIPVRLGGPGGALPDDPGLIPSTSFSMGSFGASFLHSQSVRGMEPEKPRRMHTQWFGLRWFTGTLERPVSGHSTIAAAHAIFEISRLAHFEATRHLVENMPVEFFIPALTDVICFVTDMGIISVRRKTSSEESYLMSRDYASAVDRYEVHFPSNEAFSIKEKVPADLAEQLASALGLPYGAEAIEDIALSKRGGYYVARLGSCAYVRQCKPSMESLMAAFMTPEFKEAMAKSNGTLVAPTGIIVTAYNENEVRSGPGAEADIISRFFAPWVGLSEDSVTGEAYHVVTPYWLRLRNGGAYKVGDSLECYQASERGGSLTSIIIGRKADRMATVASAMTVVRGSCTFPVEE